MCLCACAGLMCESTQLACYMMMYTDGDEHNNNITRLANDSYTCRCCVSTRMRRFEGATGPTNRHYRRVISLMNSNVGDQLNPDQLCTRSGSGCIAGVIVARLV